MAKCDVCGNDYDKPLSVTQSGRTMTFDSFECAINAMAPRCAHCNAGSSGTASRRQARSTAAPTARSTKA